MMESGEGGTAGTLARWILSACLVVGLHAGAAWVALLWQDARAAAGSAPPAVLIDLAPPVATPETPPEAPPQPAEAPPPEPETPAPVPPDPPPDVEPAPDALPEPPPPEPTPPEPAPPGPSVQAEPVFDPPPEPPARPPETEAAAVLAPPPTRKDPPPRERKKPPAPARPVVIRPPVSPASPAGPPAATAPGVAAAPRVAPAQWKSSVGSHIRRFVMAPSGARSGNVLVTFSFDRSGRILSVQVARSSGQEALDQQALRNVRSASPIPAPPSDQVSLTLTVPIQFNIR